MQSTYKISYSQIYVIIIRYNDTFLLSLIMHYALRTKKSVIHCLGTKRNNSKAKSLHYNVNHDKLQITEAKLLNYIQVKVISIHHYNCLYVCLNSLH